MQGAVSVEGAAHRGTRLGAQGSTVVLETTGRPAFGKDEVTIQPQTSANEPAGLAIMSATNCAQGGCLVVSSAPQTEGHGGGLIADGD